MITLREYQREMIDRIIASYKQGAQRVCAVAPCGAGKTIIVAWMIARVRTRGLKTLFIVHRKELLEQADRTFTKMGINHGIIAPGVTMDTSQLVQIGSTQTVANRLDAIGDVQFIVIDEAHHAVANTWRRIIGHYNNAAVLGVTATPVRLSGSGLGDIFQDLVVGPQTAQLISRGNLVDYQYFAPPSKAAVNDVHVRMGDYVKSELETAVNQADIIGDIVNTYKKLANGLQAVCYCVTRKHSEHVAALFRAAGIAARHVDGETDKSLRATILERFKQRKIQVLCNVELFGEGLDVPNMDAVILARPTQSLTLYIQQSMRAMRIDPNNPDKRAIIIDHAGNCFRHGLPDEEREWSLAVKPRQKRRERGITLTMCDKCYQVYESTQRMCPYCGYVKPVASREIVEKDGELREIERIKKEKRMEVGKARTRQDLEQIAIERGYKMGWVSKIAQIKQIYH